MQNPLNIIVHLHKLHNLLPRVPTLYPGNHQDAQVTATCIICESGTFFWNNKNWLLMLLTRSHTKNWIVWLFNKYWHCIPSWNNQINIKVFIKLFWSCVWWRFDVLFEFQTVGSSSKFVISSVPGNVWNINTFKHPFQHPIFPQP